VSALPGKFEGEGDFVEAFWNKALLGLADEDRDGAFIFVITEEDHKEYPELPVGARLYLVEDSNGFVFSRLVRGGQALTS
jgi:hypothetical protein